MKVLSVLVAAAFVAGFTGVGVAGDYKSKSSATDSSQPSASGTSQPSATDTKPSTTEKSPSSTESSQPAASPSTGTSTEKPASKDDCKDDGWQKFGFKNQGECVSSVAQEK